MKILNTVDEGEAADMFSEVLPAARRLHLAVEAARY